jgi:NADH:ubiquinone oxidoreductase subunit K
VAAYGSVFLIATTIGLPLSLARSRTRATGLMAAAILLQACALWWVAARQHHTPYMAQKMFYLLLLVQTAGLAAIAAEVWRPLARWRWNRMLAYGVAAAAVGLTAFSVSGGRAHLNIRVAPAITAPLEQAGEWARAHVPGGCVEYLVGDDQAAYWLHLAVLGNPRLSARTADVDTYELTPALVRWLTPNGLPYAIVELPAIPDGIRDELDIVARFDTAAVAKRRGPSACEQQ